MTNEEMIRTLREYADWADGEEWEVPLMLADHLRQAAEKLEQLKAHEDTGLTPEKVLPKDKADEIALKLMRFADLESLCSYTRLCELAEADKDGRLVVLPCKVGDTMYKIFKVRTKCSVYDKYYYDEFFCYDCDCEKCDSILQDIIRPIQSNTLSSLVVYIGDIGKTVFLTREEAEAALEAMKDE